MKYDTNPTHTTTTATEAFALKRGVCQDLTHVFIAAARYLDIPARYVGGYFHRADGIVQQDAGHAWAEAYVPAIGWVAFDPASGICATDAHVRVAAGLDYLGAAPVRGARRRRRHRKRGGQVAGRRPRGSCRADRIEGYGTTRFLSDQPNGSNTPQRGVWQTGAWVGQHWVIDQAPSDRKP